MAIDFVGLSFPITKAESRRTAIKGEFPEEKEHEEKEEDDGDEEEEEDEEEEDE